MNTETAISTDYQRYAWLREAALQSISLALYPTYWRSGHRVGKSAKIAKYVGGTWRAATPASMDTVIDQAMSEIKLHGSWKDPKGKHERELFTLRYRTLKSIRHESVVFRQGRDIIFEALGGEWHCDSGATLDQAVDLLAGWNRRHLDRSADRMLELRALVQS
jgi:hypothetical protein